MKGRSVDRDQPPRALKLKRSRLQLAILAGPLVIFSLLGVLVGVKQPSVSICLTLFMLPFVGLFAFAFVKSFETVSVDDQGLRYATLWGTTALAWSDVSRIELNDATLVLAAGGGNRITLDRTHPGYGIVFVFVLRRLEPVWRQDLRTQFRSSPSIVYLWLGLCLAFTWAGLGALGWGGAMLVPGVLGLGLAGGLAFGLFRLPLRVELQDDRVRIDTWRGQTVLTPAEVVSVELRNEGGIGRAAVEVLTRSSGSFYLAHMREGEFRLFLSLRDWWLRSRPQSAREELSAQLEGPLGQNRIGQVTAAAQNAGRPPDPQLNTGARAQTDPRRTYP